MAVPSSDDISTTLYLYVRKSDAGFINTPVPCVFVTLRPFMVALKFPAPIPPTAIYNSLKPLFWNKHAFISPLITAYLQPNNPLSNSPLLLLAISL